MSGQRPVPPPLLFANYSESAALRVFRCKSLRIKVLGLLRMEPVMEPDLLFVPCFMMIEFAEGRKWRCHRVREENLRSKYQGQSRSVPVFPPTLSSLRLFPNLSSFCQFAKRHRSDEFRFRVGSADLAGPDVLVGFGFVGIAGEDRSSCG